MTLDQAINALAKDLGRVLTMVLFEPAPISERERARVAALFRPVTEPIEAAVEKVGRIERRSRAIVEAIEELLEELFGG